MEVKRNIHANIEGEKNITKDKYSNGRRRNTKDKMKR